MQLLLREMLLAACTAGASGDPAAELGGKRFAVEIADTREKLDRGLMFRDEMPEDQGMLFIFPNEAPRNFWMKNTRIPLDIMYFDKDLRMVSISADTPPCKVSPCPSYSSAAPAMYVLELNGGLAAKLGVGPGSRLKLDLKLIVSGA